MFIFLKVKILETFYLRFNLDLVSNSFLIQKKLLDRLRQMEAMVNETA